ncbi:tumor necrosis factor ligand superfamily member 4 [Hirundo rustica]|uniref:tumor necrosis factor ligand superfamily member 4 n=1 Tax=Hirundo rustica TaxID=43150 RepID=UPI00267254DF|nr:tumor necrosis factor ligand superfamily member 4 [Hirundo rustica]
MHRGREPAEHWPGGQAGNTLHLVSAVAQWILLLACLVYLGIDFLRPSASQSAKVPWTHIRYTGRSIEGAAVNLTAELGPIQIRNGSIVIPCDGLYLVSLKSSIYLDKEDWLKLTLQGTHEGTLWEQIVQGSGRTVNLTTVLYLFQEDSITLWTNSSASIWDLSFSLVLINDDKC